MAETTPAAIAAGNIRRLREYRGLTYAEVARRLTATGQPIAVLGLRRIERGDRRVDVDDLFALAAVLGVEPSRLLDAQQCNRCLGAPPSGFTCNHCGQEGP